jgi:hypothetical protein
MEFRRVLFRSGEIKQLSRTITNNTLILAKLEGAIKEEKEKEGERKKNND